MIDLAPHNPYSLTIAHPVVARAGLRGAGVERLSGSEGVGAVLSDYLHPRDEPQGAWAAAPAGVVWPEGGRGIGRARRDLGRWAGLRRPVIIGLSAPTVGQLRPLLAELDGEAHPALALDLTHVASGESARELVAATRLDWQKPLLAELPVDGPPLPALAAALGEVDALILGRGARSLAGLVAGRLAGPAAHPTLMFALRSLRQHTTQPLIVAAANLAEARAVLAAGASAVLLDTGLWTSADLAARVAAISW
jgi:dihydroorotate dehydrogenase (NAD+) catalytic subunit